MAILMGVGCEGVPMAGANTAFGSGRHPVTITTAEQPECPQHGEMDENVGVIRRHPRCHIHVLKDGYGLWICPECCIDVRTHLPFDPPPGAGQSNKNEAAMWVLFVLIQTQWHKMSEPFVDLGPGKLQAADGTPEGTEIGYATGDGSQLTVDGTGRGQWRDDIADGDEYTHEHEHGDRENDEPTHILRLERQLEPSELPEWVFDHNRAGENALVVEGPEGEIRPPSAADDSS